MASAIGGRAVLEEESAFAWTANRPAQGGIVKIAGLHEKLDRAALTNGNRARRGRGEMPGFAVGDTPRPMTVPRPDGEP